MDIGLSIGGYSRCGDFAQLGLGVGVMRMVLPPFLSRDTARDTARLQLNTELTLLAKK